MKSPGSPFSPESVAAKIRAADNETYCGLTQQFKAQPRIVEVLLFSAAKIRQSSVLQFAKEITTFCGEAILPSEFWSLAVDKNGRFSADDVFKVWLKLPKWARPTCPNSLQRAMEFATACQIQNTQEAADAGISTGEVREIRNWLNRELCVASCREKCPNRLQTMLRDCFSRVELPFPQRVGTNSLESDIIVEEEGPDPFEMWSIMPNLPSLVLKFADDQARVELSSIAATRVTKMVHDALDFAWGMKRMVRISGQSRFGKTEAIRAYCQAYPQRACMVNTPDGNSKGSLIRAMALAVGIEVEPNAQSFPLRLRLHEVLTVTRQMLVFDESHYLFPEAYDATTPPLRLNLVRNEIVDRGLPCVLSCTPQVHDRAVGRYVKKTGYSMEQWLGRQSMTFVLPEQFDKRDIAAVVRFQFPGLDDQVVRLLVAKAQQSEQFLHAAQAIGDFAIYTARKEGLQAPTIEHIKAAAHAFSVGVKDGSDATPAAASIQDPGVNELLSRRIVTPAPIAVETNRMQQVEVRP